MRVRRYPWRGGGLPDRLGAMPKSSLRREVALLRQYGKEVTAQWKAIVGGAVVVGGLWLLGLYGSASLLRIVPLLPSVITPWLTRNRLIVISVLVVVALAQYLVWRAATLRNRGLQREKTRSVIEAEVDLKFGPSSNLTPARRFELASARFEQLEKEVYSGDFSNSLEVAAFRIIFIPILQGWFAGGAGYPAWHSRLVKLIDAVSQHERDELAADDF